MPRSNDAHRLPPHCPDPSVEELDNRTRNEVQKTLLLLAHRRILRKQREALLEEFREILDHGKPVTAHLNERIAKPSRPSRRAS